MILCLASLCAGHLPASAQVISQKNRLKRLLNQQVTFGVPKGQAADAAAKSFAYYAPALVNTEILQEDSNPPEFSSATAEIVKTRLTLLQTLNQLGRTYPDLTWRTDGACINLILRADARTTNFLDRKVSVAAEMNLTAENWVKWLRAQDTGSGLIYERPFPIEGLAVYAPTKKVNLRVNPTMTLRHVLNLLSQSLDAQWVAVMKRQLDIASVDAAGHRHPIPYASTTVTFSLNETPTTSMKFHDKQQSEPKSSGTR